MAFGQNMRNNIFTESFYEQDANVLLSELDKGLRSSKLDIQCEAIVRFPRLFQKYPFPMLINSSFIKLAEFFWNGSNLLRFWVLRVCQQSEMHLDKIVHVDVFVRRIFHVIHANDPVARALALRTLGAISRLIPEKQQVHHAIRRALESLDAVEVEAAIDASEQFAAQSRSFAISMYSKITDMIESLSVPSPMKLKLIPLLKHMHHDTKTAAMVQKLYHKLLHYYAGVNYVMAILDSLTYLSARTLTGLKEQILLLIGYLDDHRLAVQHQVVNLLYNLAGAQTVHAWGEEAIAMLIDKTLKCSNAAKQRCFLSILRQLTKSTKICDYIITQQQQQIMQLCMECLASTEQNAGAGLAILTALLEFDSNELLQAPCLDLVNSHFAGLLFIVLDDETVSELSLRELLRCGIRIARVNSTFAEHLLFLVTGFLEDLEKHKTTACHLLCFALAQLTSHYQMQKFAVPVPSVHAGESMQVDDVPEKQNIVMDYLPLLLEKLQELLQAEPKAENYKIIETLAAVLLQCTMGCFLPEEILLCLEQCCEHTPSWTQYRLARSAARYGHHFLAAQIFTRICRNTYNDKVHFYLNGMSLMAQAECLLSHGLSYEQIRANYADSEYIATLDYQTEKHAFMEARAQQRAVEEQQSAELSGEQLVEAIKAERIDVKDLETALPNKIEPEYDAYAGLQIRPMSLMERLEAAITLYYQAQSNLRANSTPQYTFAFQLEFLKLRIQLLQLLHTALCMKNSWFIVPPPAIAHSMAQASRDCFQRFGHISNQLRKLVKQAHACVEGYAQLYKCSFDADANTLEFLEIAEYQCALFAYIVETVCYATPSEVPSCRVIGRQPETRYFLSTCHMMEQAMSYMPMIALGESKSITTQHLNVIVSVIETMLQSSLCLPRYFFQMLQNTQIKLSVTPQARNAGEAVLVQAGSNLVIKVEGVVQNAKTPIFRSVDMVQLNLNSVLTTPRVNDVCKSNNNTDNTTLTQYVKPQRDFISANFLLNTAIGGQWQVNLDTIVVDSHDSSWCTGPRITMLVRIVDDTTNAKNNQSPVAAGAAAGSSNSQNSSPAGANIFRRV